MFWGLGGDNSDPLSMTSMRSVVARLPLDLPQLNNTWSLGVRQDPTVWELSLPLAGPWLGKNPGCGLERNTRLPDNLKDHNSEGNLEEKCLTKINILNPHLKC